MEKIVDNRELFGALCELLRIKDARGITRLELVMESAKPTRLTIERFVYAENGKLAISESGLSMVTEHYDLVKIGTTSAKQTADAASEAVSRAARIGQ